MFIANIMREAPSPCHSTIDYSDDDWDDKWRAGEIGRLCTGALIMAANSAKVARNKRMVPVVPRDTETVFTTPQEFIAYHEGAAVRSWEFSDDRSMGRLPARDGAPLLPKRRNT